MKTTSIIIIFILLPLMLSAKEPDGPAPVSTEEETTAVSLAENPALIIGLDLAGAYRLFGPPDEVFTHRGEKAEYDDVVFLYRETHVSLFWYENRVWVIRFDNNYSGGFFSLRMGMKKSDVMKSLNAPSKDVGDSLIFFLPDSGYPIRLRLYFENNLLSDAYLYRGDF